MDNVAENHDRFVFVVCQHGAEKAAKQEVTQNHPLRLAFSRPGFITFKTDAADPLPEKFSLKSTLSRTSGWSVKRFSGDDAEAMSHQVAEEIAALDVKHLHVWQRDSAIPGTKGFEPGISPWSQEIADLIGADPKLQQTKISINEVAKPLDKIADVVLVEPGEWWLGYHFASTAAGRWPGGIPKFKTPTEIVNRAYLKTREAVAWTGMTVRPGDVCAEIGSAPGGSCQFLLDCGATVIGIDPAEMDEEILMRENFRHIRKRRHEVKKKEFKDVKWLFADINVVPAYTMETVGEIVRHPSNNIQGVILTLKLTDWKFVAEIPDLLNRVREMGFQVVKSRQLAFNRREFCLAAFTDKFVLRAGKKRTPKRRSVKKGGSKSKKKSDS